MQTFDVDDDVVDLVKELARPKPFEPFSDALRRILIKLNGVEVSEAPPKLAAKLPLGGDKPPAEREQVSFGEEARRRRPKADLRELVRRGLLTEGQDLFLIDHRGDRLADMKATISGSKLKYKGKLHSMSPLAGQLLQDAGFAESEYSGPRHWATADGTSVWNLWLEVLKRKGAK